MKSLATLPRWTLLLGALLLSDLLASAAQPLTLNLRHRTETAPGSGSWKVEASLTQLPAERTALVICDMWNQHWCEGATRRVAEMAPRLNDVAREVRRRGGLVIHCPSDTMYNSRKAPYVPHCIGTELMIEHVETYCCPTATSSDLLGGEPFRFQEDVRPKVVIMIGEDEYETWETLPSFAAKELDWRGLQTTIIKADTNDKNQFPGLVEALADADLLVVSVRRRTPTPEVLAAIRRHLEQGKPLVGIRTASHAFAVRDATTLAEINADPNRAAWQSFDPEVLGGHYSNHHGNGPKTRLTVAEGAAEHPILTGVDVKAFQGNGSLYKVTPLEAGTQPLLIGSIDGQPPEPVAWTREYGPRKAKVFYTSLGHPGDFDNEAFRRFWLNALLWAVGHPIPPADAQALFHTVANAQPASGHATDSSGQPDQPMRPRESLQAFTVPEDLELELVLSEPVIAQPLQLSFDERGRLWVAEYRQYPAPSGLDLVSHDEYWRAVYDKVPPPPPHHIPGRDRVSIHEDTDGDGAYDSHKVFVDGLNIATSMATGRGGVWVLNPPYLLFYPDRNGDDVPDSDPEVHLSGFGLEDTHSVVNSLRWGPDGWLYAAQGSTVSARVRVHGLPSDVRLARQDRPDTNHVVYSQGQSIWRYHPERRRYEIFAEGGGNVFGVEMDAKGRIFSGHNGGDTRGYHYMQGAYLRKGFNKHGPLSNPYAFGFFPHMPHNAVERFTHTFLIYEAGALPERYRGRLFGVEPLQGRVVVSDIQPLGSTFQTRDIERPVTTTDRWFKPVDIKVGPDGAIYIADWYDLQVNHWRNYQGNMDASNGRVYRLKARGATSLAPFNLGSLTDEPLVAHLRDANPWQRQTARHILADRGGKISVDALKAMLQEGTAQPALEGLWALYVARGPSAMEPYLGHQDPFVRLWAVRLLGDEGKVSGGAELALQRMAAEESNVEVRAQLACTAKRLPASQALPLIRLLLAHDEDASDLRQSLLLWWALESKSESDRESVLALFDDSTLWSWVMVEGTILERIMRRYAASGTRQDLLACAALLEKAPTQPHRLALMKGFEEAFKGRSLAGLPDPLVKAMAAHELGSPAFQLRQGRPGAMQKAIAVMADAKADPDERRAYIEIAGDIRAGEAVPVMLRLVAQDGPATVRKAALTALQSFDSGDIGQTVAAAYPGLPETVRPAALTLLVSRPEWVGYLLTAVEEKKIQAGDVPGPLKARLRGHSEGSLAKRAEALWPGVGDPKAGDVEGTLVALQVVLAEGNGNPYQGKVLFDQACAACHTLFDQGGHIGPDLTTYQRSDLRNLLLSIVHPNAEIREGFETFQVETKDGRSLTGFVVEQDPNVVVLRGMDGQNVSLETGGVATMKAAGMSLMPEGLLDAYEPQQLRDLFAYLRSSQPLP